jgi:hypothetical protein
MSPSEIYNVGSLFNESETEMYTYTRRNIRKSLLMYGRQILGGFPAATAAPATRQVTSKIEEETTWLLGC